MLSSVVEWSFSQLKQVKQTLKYDFASVNLNLLHIGENANTSELKPSPFAETCNFFRDKVIHWEIMQRHLCW